MKASFCSGVFPSLDSCFVLYATIAVAALLVCLTQWIRSCPFGLGMAERFVISFSEEPELPLGAPPQPQRQGLLPPRAYPETREKRRMISEDRGGNKSGPLQEGNTSISCRISIRQLLCDDMTCPICERTAVEAEKVVRSQEMSVWFPVAQKCQSPPTISYVDRSSLPAVSELEGYNAVAQSTREPTPDGTIPQWAPDGARPCQEREEEQQEWQERLVIQFTHQAHSSGYEEDGSHPSSQDICNWEEHMGSSVDSGGQEEDALSSSSHQSDGTLVSHTDRSSSSSPAPLESEEVCVWRDSELARQQSVSRESQGEHGQGRSFTQESNPLVSAVMMTKPRLGASPPGMSQSQRTAFPAGDMPFLVADVRAALERHVGTKRLQQQLGLPLVLLKSLRAFAPLSPDPPSRWPPRRDVAVLTKPQVLSFLSVASRCRLERHITKLVHFRHWGMPRRLHETLRHMRPDPPPTTMPRATGAAFGAQEPHKPRLHLPATSPDETRLPFPPTKSQGKRQVHIAKELLEMGQESVPEPLQSFQPVTTAAKESKVALPKWIPRHRGYPQGRRGPSLSLRRKADAVDMSIKRKCIHFLWGLPTPYTESLPLMMPSAPMPPAAPSRAKAPTGFGFTVMPFLVPCDRHCLESHVLRKRAQHQWGLPRIVHRSVLHFLPPAPPVSCAATPWIRLDVEIVVTSSSLPFITTDAKRHLEVHLKSKIIERQWGLPKRVLESLHMFIPLSPARLKVALVSLQEKRRLPTREPPDLVQREPPKVSPDQKHSVLTRHTAQKAIEIQLELPATVTPGSKPRKEALAKMVPLGSQVQRPRSAELLFVEQAALRQIELNIIHKDLMCRWGLRTVYSESLSSLCQEATSQAPPLPLPSGEGAISAFTATGTPFVEPGARAELDWHVRRKALQHSWGVPAFFQRSLHSLLPSAPGSRRHQTPGRVEVTALQAELSFLKDTTIKELEKNVQKRIVLQRWQLPRRVLESLRMLHPGEALSSERQQAPQPVAVPSRRQAPTQSSSWGSAAPCQACQLPTLEPKAVEQLEHHLAKKCLAEQLAIPPCVSWHQTLYPLRTHLPKSIARGHGVVQPRKSSCFPGIHTRDMDRLELTIQCSHLASLWGLGPRDPQTVGSLAPRPPTQPLRPKWASFVCQETLTSFVHQDGRDALERHVTKKRLHHEWGFPNLVQKSLKRFMDELLTMPAKPKAEIHVCAPPQMVTFIPQDTRSCLESHVQRMKWQRLWGLPKRVLESLLRLPPGSRIAAARPEDTKEPGGRMAVSTAQFPPKVLGKLEIHLAKKSVAVQLGISAAWMDHSGQDAPRALRQPLPKPILPGQGLLAPRSNLLPFVRPEDRDQVELAIQHGLVTSLWGLGPRYVDAAGKGIPKVPLQRLRPRTDAQPLVLSEGPAPVILPQEREGLELHIQRKRLQHQWGFPALVRMSLRGFSQGAPRQLAPPKPGAYVQILRQELSFLPWDTHCLLEFHVQKMKRYHLWGLPGRVLRSTRQLSPQSWADAGEPGWPGTSQSRGGSYPEARAVVGAASTRRGRFAVTSRWRLLTRLQHHLAKKSVELQLGVLPDIVSFSWRLTARPLRQHLPKTMRPGCMLHQLRSPARPSFPSAEVDRIEMAVQRSHLASLWGLGTCYAGAVGELVSRPSIGPLRAGLQCPEAQTPFLREQEREALEGHIRRKKIHHEWGFSAVVQKSLKAFMPGFAPLLATLPKPKTSHAHIRQQEAPAFLPQDICRGLEGHVQKLKLQQQWGLPRRVLASLQRFGLAPSTEASRNPPELIGSSSSCLRRLSPGSLAVDVAPMEQDSWQRRGLTRELLPRVDYRHLSMVKLHLAQKCVEIQLGALPTVVSISWQGARLHAERRLPKPVHSSHWNVTPRSGSLLSFLHAGDVRRIESAVRRNHFASLWGLGMRYGEAVTGLAMRPLAPSSKHRAADVEFLEVQTSFLQDANRHALERHVNKKRLQQGWGSPLLVRRSLAGFGHRAPSVPARQHVEIHVHVLVQELVFLPLDSQRSLEHHIQKRKLQWQWGLPQRILSPLKTFCPSASTIRASSYQIGGFPQDAFDIQLEAEAQRRGPLARTFSSDQKAVLQRHLSKKHLQMSREGSPLPRLVRESQRKASGSGQRHLPALSCLGPNLKCLRDASRLRLPPDTVKELEQNVKRKYVAYAWGLPNPSSAPRSRVAPASAIPVPSRPQEAGNAFLQAEEQVTLENHIQKKRLQHQWGLPSAVQKSLRAFVPLPPAQSQCLPQGAGQEIRIRVAEPCFWNACVWKELEDSMKIMIIRQRWGLPKRISDSLHALSPAALAVREQLPHQEQAAHAEFMRWGRSVARGPEARKALRVRRALQEPEMGRVPPETPVAPSSAVVSHDFSRITQPKTHQMEIKIQMRGGPKALAAHSLPKNDHRYGVMKSRSLFLPFLEQEKVETVELNIRQKCMVHLWGLSTPSMEALRRREMSTIAWSRASRVTAGLGAVRMALQREEDKGETGRRVYKQKLVARTAAGENLPVSQKRPPLLTAEAQERLEIHIHHKWGLLVSVQEPLTTFWPLPPPAQRSPQALEGTGPGPGPATQVSAPGESLEEVQKTREEVSRKSLHAAKEEGVASTIRRFTEEVDSPGERPRGVKGSQATVCRSFASESPQATEETSVDSKRPPMMEVAIAKESSSTTELTSVTQDSPQTTEEPNVTRGFPHDAVEEANMATETLHRAEKETTTEMESQEVVTAERSQATEEEASSAIAEATEKVPPESPKAMDHVSGGSPQASTSVETPQVAGKESPALARPEATEEDSPPTEESRKATETLQVARMEWTTVTVSQEVTEEIIFTAGRSQAMGGRTAIAEATENVPPESPKATDHVLGGSLQSSTSVETRQVAGKETLAIASPQAMEEVSTATPVATEHGASESPQAMEEEVHVAIAETTERFPTDSPQTTHHVPGGSLQASEESGMATEILQVARMERSSVTVSQEVTEEIIFTAGSSQAMGGSTAIAEVIEQVPPECLPTTKHVPGGSPQAGTSVETRQVAGKETLSTEAMEDVSTATPVATEHGASESPQAMEEEVHVAIAETTERFPTDSPQTTHHVPGGSMQASEESGMATETLQVARMERSTVTVRQEVTEEMVFTAGSSQAMGGTTAIAEATENVPPESPKATDHVLGGSLQSSTSVETRQVAGKETLAIASPEAMEEVSTATPVATEHGASESPQAMEEEIHVAIAETTERFPIDSPETTHHVPGGSLQASEESGMATEILQVARMERSTVTVSQEVMEEIIFTAGSSQAMGGSTAIAEVIEQVPPECLPTTKHVPGGSPQAGTSVETRQVAGKEMLSPEAMEDVSTATPIATEHGASESPQAMEEEVHVAIAETTERFPTDSPQTTHHVPGGSLQAPEESGMATETLQVARMERSTVTVRQEVTEEMVFTAGSSQAMEGSTAVAEVIEQVPPECLPTTEHVPGGSMQACEASGMATETLKVARMEWTTVTVSQEVTEEMFFTAGSSQAMGGSTAVAEVIEQVPPECLPTTEHVPGGSPQASTSVETRQVAGKETPAIASPEATKEDKPQATWEVSTTVPEAPEKEVASESPQSSEDVSILRTESAELATEEVSSDGPLVATAGAPWETSQAAGEMATAVESPQEPEAKSVASKCSLAPQDRDLALEIPQDHADRGHILTQSPLEGPEEAQRSLTVAHRPMPKTMEAFATPALPSSPSSNKMRSVLEDQSLAEATEESHSSSQDKPPTYQTALWLKVDPRGRLGSWVATGKPPFSLSPQRQATVVTPAGAGGQERRADGGAWQGKWRWRSALCIHLQQVTVPPFSGGPPHELRSTTQPSLLAESTADVFSVRHGSAQIPSPWELSDVGHGTEPTPTCSIERLLWDKEKVSLQLEGHFQRMVQDSRCRRKSPASETSQDVCSPGVHHPAVCRQDRVQPRPPRAKEAEASSSGCAWDDETQSSDLASAATPGTLHSPAKLAEVRWLSTHVSQRALGSFILPPRVISSHANYESLMTGRHRQAARERRERLSSRFQRGRKEPSQGQGASSTDGRKQTSGAPPVARHTWEHPPSPNRSGDSTEQLVEESSQATEGNREASSEGSGSPSWGSSQQLSSSVGASGELPPPPSDWFHSSAAERESARSSSAPSKQGPLSVGADPSFSTECEWERVGDWDSEHVEVCGRSEKLGMAERSNKQSSGPRPREQGTVLTAELSLRPQGEGPPSQGREASLTMSIVAPILDSQEGLHSWLHHQEATQRAVRKEQKGGPGAEEVKETKEIQRREGSLETKGLDGDRSRGKTSEGKSGVRRGRRKRGGHSPERLTGGKRRGSESRKQAPSSQKRRSCHKESDSISSETQTSSSGAWTPPAPPGKSQRRREWATHKREKVALIRVRFRGQCAACMEETLMAQDSVVPLPLPARQNPAAARASRRTGPFCKSGGVFFRPQPSQGQESRAMAESRLEVPREASPPRCPQQRHACSATSAVHLGRPHGHFCPLQEKILSRRRELGSSLESDDEGNLS